MEDNIYLVKKCDIEGNYWKISIEVDVDEVSKVTDFDEYSAEEKESIWALAVILKRMGVVA
jgi:hypothetical protein